MRLVILFFFFVIILGSIVVLLRNKTVNKITPPTYTTAYWTKQIQTHGGTAAYKEFATVTTTIPYMKQHGAAHVFGQLLYKTIGLEGVTVCDKSFAYGCYHGFISSALSQQGPQILSTLNVICIHQYGKNETGCRHGIGHGLLEYTGAPSIARALALCNTIQPTHILGCTQGVFMEYNFPAVTIQGEIKPTRRALTDNNPFIPCSFVSDEFKNSCVFELPEWWHFEFHGDYSKMGLLCSQLTDQTLQQTCFLGLGRSAGELSFYNPKQATEDCQKMPTKNAQLYCKAGLSWIFSINNEKKSLAKFFCEGSETCIQIAQSLQ